MVWNPNTGRNETPTTTTNPNQNPNSNPPTHWNPDTGRTEDVNGNLVSYPNAPANQYSYYNPNSSVAIEEKEAQNQQIDLQKQKQEIITGNLKKLGYNPNVDTKSGSISFTNQGTKTIITSGGDVVTTKSQTATAFGNLPTPQPVQPQSRTNTIQNFEQLAEYPYGIENQRTSISTHNLLKTPEGRKLFMAENIYNFQLENLGKGKPGEYSKFISRPDYQTLNLLHQGEYNLDIMSEKLRSYESTQADFPTILYNLGAGKPLQTPGRALPSAALGLEYTSGYISGIRTKPVETAINTGIFFALPTGLGLVAKGVRLVPYAEAAYKFLEPVAAYGLAGIYGASVGARTLTAEKPFKELGVISSTEVTPMLVGGYFGAKAYLTGQGFLTTIGRKAIEPSEIISQKVLKEGGLDVYPPREHYKLFTEAKNPIADVKSTITEDSLLKGTFNYKGKQIPYPQDLTQWVKQYGRSALKELYNTPKFKSYINAKQSEQFFQEPVVLHAGSGFKQTATTDILYKGGISIGRVDFEYIQNAGAYVAPSDKLAAGFLGLGGGYYPAEEYSFSLLNFAEPRVAAFYPKGFRVRKAVPTGLKVPSGQKEFRFLGKDIPGIVDIPKIKTEPEGLLFGDVKKSATRYYTTYRGVRIPIDEFRFIEEGGIGKGKPIKNVTKGYEPFEYVRSSLSPKPSLLAFSYTSSSLKSNPYSVSYTSKSSRTSSKSSSVLSSSSLISSPSSSVMSSQSSADSYFSSPSSRISYPSSSELKSYTSSLASYSRSSRSSSYKSFSSSIIKTPETLLGFKFGKQKEKKKKSKKVSLQKYLPSFGALEKGIYGKPSRNLTGLELFRPITKKYTGLI